jgi:hypothetical protein
VRVNVTWGKICWEDQDKVAGKENVPSGAAASP